MDAGDREEEGELEIDGGGPDVWILYSSGKETVGEVAEDAGISNVAVS